MKKNMVLLSVLCAIVMVAASGCKPVENGGGGPRYAVGDTGPAGGKIFYVKSEFSDGWQFLEAAPVDVDRKYAWDTTDPVEKSVSTKIAIGSGKVNTDAIITALDVAGAAAKAARAYTGGDKTDWFLPSYSELDALYTVRDKIGRFESDIYWSSSQGRALINPIVSSAWYYNFATGNSGYETDNKHDVYAVRAIRAF